MSDVETVVPNDFVAQWSAIRDDAQAALDRVGKSGWWVLGAEVQEFEAVLARYFAVRFVIGTGNGLDALEIALRVAGLQSGDRVLTTPLSAFATTLAIVRAGGVPVFADVDGSGLLDLSRAEAAVAAGNIRFMLPVHLYGHVLDLDRLAALAKRYDVVVIEDCAQSVLATSNGCKAGSIGLLAATSFYPTKNLGCLGDGGAVLTNDEEASRRARALRDYGQSMKYVHDRIGLNSRLDEVQAAFLRTALLPRLEDWTARRRDIAARYRAGLCSRRVVAPPVPEASASVWHLFPTLVSGNRDGFLAHLRSRGIVGGVHYPNLIPHQGALGGVPFDIAGPLDNAAHFARCEVSLPIHPFMSDENVTRVLDACNAW